MAVTDTGSTVIGLMPGLPYSNLPSGTRALGVRLIYVYGNPNGVVTCITGSDIAYDIAGGKFYTGDITNGAGGSAWTGPMKSA